MNKTKATVHVDTSRCKGCGYCINACPKGAIYPSGELNTKGYEAVLVNKEKCIGCGICYTMCPDNVFALD